MSITIKAPHPYATCPRPWIFLAGSIEMGKAELWQDKASAQLRRGTALNPRRDDWDSSWEQSIDNPRFYEQVTWELQALEDADLILLYFDPATKSPISLLELGLFRHKMVVCCPQGFWRKGNVDMVCARYHIRQVPHLEALIQSVQIPFQ